MRPTISTAWLLLQTRYQSRHHSTMSQKRKRGDTGKRLVSYGVLLYKRVGNQPDGIRFLLGMIPQRNAWTVFKGMPSQKDDGSDESPAETALREFEEETGSQGLLSLQEFRPEATLHGRASKKHLEIYLHEGSFFDEQESFFAERVVKIDEGYMKGRPEIIAVRWLTLQQAMEGADLAKVYKSQEPILQEAFAILTSRDDQMSGDEEGDGDDTSDQGDGGQNGGCQSSEY
eukprot:scaffold5538_cov159-Amphora_coffeaeformis.AAC.12